MLSAAAVVVCALGLLGRSHAAAPIEFVTAPPTRASADAEGFLVRAPLAIVLVTSTEAFRNAAQPAWSSAHDDGCRKIASIIVHEEWHLRHGPDEEDAYAAQITTLTMLGASSMMITSVRRSRDAVLARQRAGVVLARRDD
jgi:hypothetical protein